MNAQIPARLLLGLLVLLLAAGCATASAADNAETGGAANSGAGLWYTLITAVVAFVVGFLVAATMSLSGGFRLSTHRHRRRHRTEFDRNRGSQHIGAGIRQELAEWRCAEHNEVADWDELGRRIEDRIREDLRNHRK
jgi:hypothetical protein